MDFKQLLVVCFAWLPKGVPHALCTLVVSQGFGQSLYSEFETYPLSGYLASRVSPSIFISLASLKLSPLSYYANKISVKQSSPRTVLLSVIQWKTPLLFLSEFFKHEVFLICVQLVQWLARIWGKVYTRFKVPFLLWLSSRTLTPKFSGYLPF